MIKTKEELLKTLERLDRDSFVPLTYDKFFKAIMESNTDIFKDFLIKALDLEEYTKDNYIMFLNNELICEHIKEHGKVVDINVKLGNNLIINVEINTEEYSTIRGRNDLYLEKIDISNFKETETYSSLNKKKIYQLNLNTNPRENKSIGKSLVMDYDIINKKIDNTRKKKVGYNLVHYYNKWYNGDKEMTYIEYLLSALYSHSYVEIYHILSNIFDSDRLNKIMEDIINMIDDDGYVLHAWMKEKFDGYVAYNKELVNKTRTENEKDIQTIKNMLKKNIDYETISEVTGKSIEDIKRISSPDFDADDYICEEIEKLEL